MISTHRSAMRSTPHPVSAGFPLKPKPGSDGHTTCIASAASPPWDVGSVSGPITSRNSTIEPGHPWVNTTR